MATLTAKVLYNSKSMKMYFDPITLDRLTEEVRAFCNFQPGQEFTMKWIDEEGDPCMLSNQEELDEMLRLYNRNSLKEPEVVIRIFSSRPLIPGMPCPGEDSNIYRRGAIRWREKTKYKIYGHIYEPKRFNRKASCVFCHDRIWGLGRCGFKCLNCKKMVHKKCHKLWKNVCGQNDDNLWDNNGRLAIDENRLPNSGYNAHNRHKGSKSTFHKGSQLSPLERFEEQNIDQDQHQVSGPPQYKLEDFELLRVIGRGSYAKVLMVELKSTRRIYAMKVIKKEMFIGDEDIDWVQTEKHVFETASNHPFLVGLHSCFQTRSRLFFVIEFVRGGDLMFHMQRHRKLAEDHARFYAAEICLALNYLHVRGIIYRDLKLDNVLLDHEGHIKLTDYGMCKEGIRNGEKTSTFCGTPNYISPELLRGESYDCAVDYWALGVLLYEMLAGRSPFDTTLAPERENSEDALFSIILEKTIRIPRSLTVRAQNILRGFLEKNPVERLGCKPNIGFKEILEHRFFETIDWDALERRQVCPPYKPQTESDRDLDHFDPQFTEEPVILTPDVESEIDKISQSEFEGFSFVNPLLMSVEDCV